MRSKRKSSLIENTIKESFQVDESLARRYLTNSSEKATMITLPFLTDVLRPFLTLAETSEITAVQQMYDVDKNAYVLVLTIGVPDEED